MESQNRIELGDIVKIISVPNHKLHEASFYVSYLDFSSTIELIHIGTMDSYTLLIVNGKLVDEEIKAIQVVNRSNQKGYCRQNGLLTNAWVTIEFGGEIPYIMTGQITHLEEDMITLQTYPEMDILYIDFEYKGIPKHIPLTKICIRDKPSSYDSVEGKSVEEIIDEVDQEMSMVSEENGDYIVTLPKTIKVDSNYQDELSKLYNETNIEEVPEDFEYKIDTPPQFVKYKLETQINSLLDDLLASISDANRNDRVLRTIYTHVNRFQELRDEFSIKDSYGQIVSVLKKNPLLHKPLADVLLNMNKNITWIKPVVSQYKKLYDVRINPNMFNVVSTPSLTSLNLEQEYENNIMNMNYENNQNVKYQNLYQEWASEMNKPYTSDWKSQDTITDITVATDIDTIISNNDDFLSTCIERKAKINYPKDNLFTTFRYTSLVDYSAYDSKTRQTTLKTLMNSETMSINSLVLMPSIFVKYSKLYLPSSSILHKSNLHASNMYLYALLTKRNLKRMMVHDVHITEKINQDTTLLPLEKTLIHVKLDQSQEVLEDKTEFEKYTLFLQQSMPSLFNILHDVTKKNTHLYNISDYLDALEPYYIYRNDLSFKALETIKYHIRDNIQEFVNMYQEKLQQYNTLKMYKFKMGNLRSYIYDHISNNLFYEDLTLKHEFLKTYFVHGFDNLTNSELINTAHMKDTASLLYHYVKLASIHLVSPIELVLNKKTDDDFMGITVNDDCSRKNLSKRYTSIKQLQDDNDNRELFYDDEFDDTNYDILKKYKKEKESMDNAVFVDFLAEKLILEHKCPRSKSEEMVNTLIRGKKIVNEGDYAILEIRPQYIDGDESSLSEKEKNEMKIEADVRRTVNYYRRVKYVWIYDKDIHENAFMNTNALLCNLKSNCYKNEAEDTCESVMEDTRNRLQKQSKKDILSEFSERFIIEDVEKRKKLIQTSIEDQRNILNSKMDMDIFLKKLFDLKSYSIGKNAVFTENVVSPYQHLHDLIIQPNFDFYKKQEYIIKLVHNYCRDPLPSENPYWKYCLDTNVKLVETSLYTLAVAFQNNEYNKVLSHLCRTIGKEDGEYVYDKETGCILKTIDYQEDLFKDFHYDTIEEDELEEVFDQLEIDEQNTNSDMEVSATFKKMKIYHLDEETQYFYNLMLVLCKKSEGADIEIEAIQDVVLQLCTSLLTDKKIFMDETIYNKLQEERKKKNSKATAPVYKKYIATKKLEVLVSSVIIAVQCLIPSMRKRKTFPGCVQSFIGYPVDEGMNDMSTITYFSCILRKMAKDSDTSPWNTVTKKENAMEERIKIMLEKFVVPHPYSKILLDKKRLYNAQHAHDEIIPDDLNVSKRWLRFTPIIVPFIVSSGKDSIDNVSDGFQQELMITLKQGKPTQWSHIGVLHHKIDLFSAAVIQSIKQIVKSQQPLLVTNSKIPFLQNSCCIHEEQFSTPLQYFQQEDNVIEKYIKNCMINSYALRDIQLLTKAYYLHEKPRSKIVNSSDKQLVKNSYKHYSEKSMYTGFIQYCSLDNETVPIPDDLKVIMDEKLENYNKDASIEEKIDFLKNNGKRISETKFIEMMKIVNKRNCVPLHNYDVNFRAEVKTNIEALEKMFQEYQHIPDSLRKFVDIFWKIFDHETEDIQKIIQEEEDAIVSCNIQDIDETASEPKLKRDDKTSKESKYDAFINFITPEIEELKKKLQSFLGQNRKLFPASKLNSIFEKLFTFQNEDHYIQYCTFMKNYLYAIHIYYPHRITNPNFNVQFKVPSHWQITEYDEMTLKHFVNEIHDKIDKYRDDPRLSTLLKNTQMIFRPISSILQYFYTFFPEQNTKMYVRLFQYLCLTTFLIHIELSSERIIVQETFHAIRKDERDENELSDMIEIEQNVPVDDVQASIQQALSELFEIYFTRLLSQNHDYTTLSYKDIMNRIQQSVEEEKHSVKEYFRKMSKETRRAEMIMKSLHLGIFNVNNRKLITYGNDQNNLFGAVVSEMDMDKETEEMDVDDNAVDLVRDDMLAEIDMEETEPEIENE